MTWVNLKQLDARVEERIMVLINSRAGGMALNGIQAYFSPGGPQSQVLRVDVPGWLELSSVKRGNRLNRIIRGLIKSGRARIDRKGETVPLDEQLNRNPFIDDRLVPLNALDRIVYALKSEEAEQEAAQRGQEA